MAQGTIALITWSVALLSFVFAWFCFHLLTQAGSMGSYSADAGLRNYCWCPQLPLSTTDGWLVLGGSVATQF